MLENFFRDRGSSVLLLVRIYRGYVSRLAKGPVFKGISNYTTESHATDDYFAGGIAGRFSFL